MRTLTLGDGAVRFTLVKPCGRCSMPSNNQNTGTRTRGGEPTRTLQSYRKGSDLRRDAQLHKAHFVQNGDEVFFGQNALVEFRHSGRAALEVGNFAEVGQ